MQNRANRRGRMNPDGRTGLNDGPRRTTPRPFAASSPRDSSARPTAGAVIAGTGGLRKLRSGATGRGKRGGLRLIYYWHQRSGRLLLLLAYAKNERDDLTGEQKALLRAIVEKEYR